jgi:hypothetical protein
VGTPELGALRLDSPAAGTLAGGLLASVGDSPRTRCSSRGSVASLASAGSVGATAMAALELGAAGARGGFLAGAGESKAGDADDPMDEDRIPSARKGAEELRPMSAASRSAR